MQLIWLYAQFTTPFLFVVDWLARLQWNVSNTDALKTTILVLSSEVSLFQIQEATTFAREYQYILFGN